MKGKVLILLLFVSIGLYGQQDLLYTQFAYDKLGLNAAYAGNYNHTSLSMLYRNQWIGLQGAPRVFSVSSNFPALNNRVGIGINLNQSKIAIYSRTTFEGSYAYKIPTDNGIFSLGLSTSWRQFLVDFTDDIIQPLDGWDNDPTISPFKFSKIIFNIGLGFYYTSDHFYAGISIPRFSKADLDFDQSEPLEGTEIRHTYFMAGGKWNVSYLIELSPQLLIKIPEDTPIKFEFNLTSIIDEKYHAGINYSTGGSSEQPIESLDLILGLQYSNQIFFGLSYDFSFTKLAQYENGSVELVANYRFVKRSKADIIINPRYY